MSLDQAEIDAMIEAVRRVSRAEILPRFRALGASEIDTKSAADDLVTVADKASEDRLSQAFSEILPGAGIVGEEAVSANASVLDQIGSPGTTVVIDPIDGTWNYANGISSFGVIVAVLVDGEIEFGLLYDPMGDDWVVARKGRGAWFQRPGQVPVRLSTPEADPPLDESFGLVGFYLFSRTGQARLAETLPLFRRTATLRCAAHEYRLMAQGRAGFMLQGRLNVWDHAAGVLAVREAGGVARLIDGPEYTPAMKDAGRLLVAANEGIWARLAELWADVDAP